jgi:1-acyl-sn-glycerol-3-phosphate acyltransferase
MKGKTATPKKDDKDVQFLDYCSLSLADVRKMARGSDEDRENPCVPVSTVKMEDVTKIQEMSFWDELKCVLFLAFVVPNGVFTLPPVVFFIGKFLVGNVQLTFLVAGLLLLPLAILPQPYVPSTLQSWIAIQTCKYFSFRFIMEERPPHPEQSKNGGTYHPRIMVAPPHGVFPYGNILAMLVWPAMVGHNFRGLASSAALRPPIFKQVLRSIGVIDASRHVARKALENGESLGISTGGVAEVFETNEADECILLKERVGLIKLAIRSGADLVPCYLFGNTKLLRCWAGEGIPYGRSVLEKLSRKLGFALILVHGRFFLPIPFRKPVLGVMGRSIPTHHIQCEDPTPEQIEIIQTILLEEMEGIFDRYKHLYGWDDKKLIIK